MNGPTLALVKDLSLHPITNFIPVMADEEKADLLESIKANGIREPLWIWQGSVIDGRHRLGAAKKLKLEKVPIRECKGTEEELLRIVIDLNLSRRHLTIGQRAMTGARLKDKLAELAKARQAHGQTAPGKTLSANLREVSRKAAHDAAKTVGVSPRTVESACKVLKDGVKELVTVVESGAVTVSVGEKIAKLPKEEQQKILSTPGQKKQALRIHNRTKKLAKVIKQNIERPKEKKQYSVIYADPPWQYECNLKNDRAVDNHYPTESVDDICKEKIWGRRVEEIADKDCILFMWTTAPKVMEAGEVIKAWGFKYTTCAIWDKGKIGIGNYFRIQHELLLVATRGKDIAPAEKNRVSSVLKYPLGKHSAKPKEVYELIECMYPNNVARIELYARNKRDGWDSWGNEV